MKHHYRKNSFPPKGKSKRDKRREKVAAPVEVKPEQPPISTGMQELAKQILENPSYEKVCEFIRWEALNEIGSSSPEDKKYREERYARVRAVDDVSMRLSALASSGRIPKRNA